MKDRRLKAARVDALRVIPILERAIDQCRAGGAEPEAQELDGIVADVRKAAFNPWCGASALKARISKARAAASKYDGLGLVAAVDASRAS